MSLLRIFLSLQLPDGRPDLSLRRSQLESLVPYLTRSEIRHFREQFDSLALSRKGNDVFNEIPHELCLKIIDNLYLEDLLRMRLVCQSWHRCFCNLDFGIHILKKYFELPLGYYFKNFDPGCIELEENKKKEKYLQRFMINRIRREHGIPAKIYHLNLMYDPVGLSRCLGYSKGRIAIQEGSTVRVRDLISTEERVFVTPNRVPMKEWLLSDQYLIGSAFVSELLAWNLVSKDMYRIRLPASAYSLSAYHNKVGIVTSSFEILIWTVGGALKRLYKVQPEENFFVGIRAANIFFDFKDTDKLFLAYHSLIKPSFDAKYTTRITIKCFVAGILSRTQHTNIYTWTARIRCRSILISNENLIGMQVWEDPSKKEDDNPYRLVTYDMNERQFGCVEIRLHPTMIHKLFFHNNLIWRDQIYFPVEEVESTDIKSLQVITISKSLSDIWNHLSLDHASSILFGENRSHSERTVVQAIDFKNVRRIRKEWKIWCDDSFIVIEVGQELKVLRFHDLGC